jgi:5-formyltetrahydrofolate cyclo-ligase
MTKSELRTIYIAKRKALTDADYMQAGQKISEYFFAAIDLSFIKILHLFLPIEKQREPNTWLIIDRIRREFPNVRLAIPRVNPDSGTLDNFFFEGLHQLTTNVWGIPEPKQGIPTPTENIDMVLVPMLTFDREGHRVGYGKGFYDKLLAECSPRCKAIGLSLFGPVEKIIDTASHDFPLHQVVTPNGVFTF